MGLVAAKIIVLFFSYEVLIGELREDLKRPCAGYHTGHGGYGCEGVDGVKEVPKVPKVEVEGFSIDDF